MDQAQLEHLKGAVEALLFVSERPVTVDQIKDAVAGSVTADIKAVLEQLKSDYDNSPRGMAVAEVAGGWQMLSAPAFAEYIREFYKTRHKEKLSRAGLEVLAIIAYKQPVSRTDVEMIRGVNSDGTVMHLLNKGLIRIAGRKEVPGRPYVYATTTQFLEYFGLRALEDLPKLEDFPALMAKANEVGDPSAGPSPDVSGENSIEDLAQARTRSDIEELQKAANMPEVQDMGEPSGQSRIMAEEPAPEGDSNEPEQAA